MALLTVGVGLILWLIGSSGVFDWLLVDDRALPTRPAVVPIPINSSGPSPTRMTLTPAQAIEIATQAAITEGIDLSLYKTPSVSADANRRTWYIFFKMKGPIVPAGGWFGFEIDDATKATTLIAGA